MARRPVTRQYDYSRRPYVSDKPYTEQARLWSDSYRDRNGGRTKHSEFKKPYMEDQTYPEMENWDIPPITPHEWPPPTMPDDPTINNLPDVDGTHYTDRDPDQPRDPFLGCNFAQPFIPNELGPGETAFAKLQRLDDPVIGFTVHGPGRIISGGNALCTAAGQELFRQQGNARPGGGNSPECTVILRVNDDVSGYAPGSTGAVEIVVVAHTESGRSCSTSVTLRQCPSAIALEYDYTTSPQTISRWSRVNVAVKGGTPPFNWSVSGTGFTLLASKTTSRGNVLVTDGTACGSATITVTDACEDEVEGGCRCTSGQWVAIDPPGCEIGWQSGADEGPVSSSPGYCNSGWLTTTRGKYKCSSCYAGSFGLVDNQIGHCPSCGEAACGTHCGYQQYYCLADLGCNECVVPHYWQYAGAGYAHIGFLCTTWDSGQSCQYPGGGYSNITCICQQQLVCWQWGC